MKSLGLFVVMVLCVLVASASGAGWSYLDPATNLGGNFSFGSTPSSAYYGSSTNVNGETSNASFWLRLDPNSNTLRNASWSFNTNSVDPTNWTANCWLSGYVGQKQVFPQNQSWSQNATNNGSEIWASLSFAAQQYPWETSPEMSIGGSLSMSNASLNSSSFRYWTGNDQYWSYPNGYDNPPVVTSIPAWYAEYNLSGKYLNATTPVLPTTPSKPIYAAEPMGLGGSNGGAVPEPSTYVLISGAIAGLGIKLWRRQR